MIHDTVTPICTILYQSVLASTYKHTEGIARLRQGVVIATPIKYWEV